MSEITYLKLVRNEPPAEKEGNGIIRAWIVATLIVAAAAASIALVLLHPLEGVLLYGACAGGLGAAAILSHEVGP